jgi:hypothetical protein
MQEYLARELLKHQGNRRLSHVLHRIRQLQEDYSDSQATVSTIRSTSQDILTAMILT